MFPALLIPILVMLATWTAPPYGHVYYRHDKPRKADPQEEWSDGYHLYTLYEEDEDFEDEGCEE
jgi:hypothetical protein